jgi:hypothetical protein
MAPWIPGPLTVPFTTGTEMLMPQEPRRGTGSMAGGPKLRVAVKMYLRWKGKEGAGFRTSWVVSGEAKDRGRRLIIDRAVESCMVSVVRSRIWTLCDSLCVIGYRSNS